MTCEITFSNDAYRCFVAATKSCDAYVGDEVDDRIPIVSYIW